MVPLYCPYVIKVSVYLYDTLFKQNGSSGYKTLLYFEKIWIWGRCVEFSQLTTWVARLSYWPRTGSDLSCFFILSLFFRFSLFTALLKYFFFANGRHKVFFQNCFAKEKRSGTNLVFVLYFPFSFVFNFSFRIVYC